MKKLFDLCSLFMAVIGSCIFILICFILFLYPKMNGQDSDYQDNITIVETPPTENLSDDHQAPDTMPVSVEPSSAELFSEEPSDTEPAIAAKADVSSEYKSALNKANDYNNIMHMSKAALYHQLTSEYGERFSPEAAQYAIDNITADWNSNALQKAKEYNDIMYMSKAAIYDQLTSEYGEKFTQEEAKYAVDNLAADYNLNALRKAKDYQNTMNMSPSAIHDQLTSEYGEKFTQEEADYAIANLD